MIILLTIITIFVIVLLSLILHSHFYDFRNINGSYENHECIGCLGINCDNCLINDDFKKWILKQNKRS